VVQTQVTIITGGTMVARERPTRKGNGIMKWARVAITEAEYMDFAE